jgi:hypothetical protein
MGTNATQALSEQRALGDIGAKECVPYRTSIPTCAVKGCCNALSVPTPLTPNHGPVVTEF